MIQGRSDTIFRIFFATRLVSKHLAVYSTSMITQRIMHGRTITSEEVQAIRELLREHPHWSRRRLSQEVCSAWNWRNFKGELRDIACRTVLLRLHRAGEIVLPRPYHDGNNTRRQVTAQVSCDETPIRCSLHDLTPLTISVPLPGSDDAALFKFLTDRHHYLGLRHVPGENMSYLVRTAGGRPVACLLFAAAAWKTADRDRFIGWTAQQCSANLSFVTNNARFLILPWVEVKNLASHVLGLIVRRVSSDWEAKYGHPVYALETFVDCSRFKGTCYRAANWQRLGQTQGRTRNDRHACIQVAVKDIYLYPLIKDFRQALCGPPDFESTGRSQG